ncbi:MAG: UvrD-helicase domain-containing protein [Halanaerobiales bacterium]|nr:UvrD-helicase domain-containing protein [Halanaerobiales bacterium]
MNKILKASAGTGKTYRLSLEYLNAVIEGTDFRNIVVMTFTRKATAEIRERIIEHLKSLENKGKASDVYRELKKISSVSGERILARVDELYVEILSSKDKINVHTIDSFVNKIFKRSIAPYLGINAYEVTDTDQESAEKVFKKILEDEQVFAQMEYFLKENRSRKIEDYTDIIEDILDQRWKFELIDYQPRPKKDNTDFINRLDNCIEIIQDICEVKSKEFDSGYFRKDYRPILERYLELEQEKEQRELIYKYHKEFLSDHFWNGGKLRGKAAAELKLSLEEEFALMQESLANTAFNNQIIEYEKEVFAFAEKIFEFYDRIKLKEKIFTYSDISNYSYHYLSDENLHLLEGRKTTDYFNELLGIDIEYLLIDEFQDTSVLQWKLLKPVINNTQHTIIVGDEKQSIYGWRGGEKELFAGLENIIIAEVDTLNTCYRSDGRILEFVNSFFADLHQDWIYEDVDVLPDRGESGYVQLLLGGKSSISYFEKDIENAGSLEKKKQLENILNTVVKDLKSEIAEQIAERKDGLGNVAVIARRGKDLDEIAEELDKRNIKYIRGSSNSIVEHEAAKPLYSLLKYLYSGDYLSLLKFLRSDLVKINHRTLKYLLKNMGKVEKALADEAEIEKTEIEKLIAEIKKLKEMNYQELIHHLFNRMGLFTIYQEQASALKNIYFFYELLNQFNSLNLLIEYIEENKDSEELQQLGIEDQDAVKLSTIHKAKGLSFDSVFYYFSPKVNGGHNRNSIKIYLDFDDNYGEVEEYLLTNSKYNFILESLAYNFIEDKNEKELMEEINNDYVAMTRAVNNLFVYVENPRKLRLEQGLLWEGSSYEFYESSLLNAAHSSSLLDLIEAQKFGDVVSNASQRPERRLDLQQFDKYFDVNFVESGAVKSALSYETNKNRLFGTIVHDYLEHIIYDKEEEHKIAANIINDKYVNIVGRDLLAEITASVKNFIKDNSEIFAERYDVYTEYTLFDGEDMKRIDRLMIDREKKKITIIDYKTGIKFEEEQLENYTDLINNKLSDDYEIESKFLVVKI